MPKRNGSWHLMRADLKSGRPGVPLGFIRIPADETSRVIRLYVHRRNEKD